MAEVDPNTRDEIAEIVRVLIEASRGSMTDIEWSMVWNTLAHDHPDIQRATALLPLVTSKEEQAWFAGFAASEDWEKPDDFPAPSNPYKVVTE